jgi:hypothetical protein
MLKIFPALSVCVCECVCMSETWYLTLIKGLRLEVFENRAPRKILGLRGRR